MTLSRSLLRSGARFTVAATILASGAFLLPSLLASSATAEDGRRSDDLADLSVCDLSACYLVLGVVDTDGDGVADADEIVLGYDPLDPESTPPLQLLLDTTFTDRLPTYELGYGTWAVFPEEFLMRLEEKWVDLHGPTLPSEVFGISTRQESIALAGIDDGLLKAAGIDLPWTNGLTFGLAALTAQGKEMGLDLGQFNGSWYSSTLSDRGTRWWAAAHGGEAETNPGDGPGTTNYGDLSKSETREVPCDLLCTSRFDTEYEDKDGNRAGSSSHTTSVDLKLGYHVDTVLKDKDGRVIKESHTVHGTDGSHATTTTTTEYQRDANGKVTGSTKTTETKTEDKKGKKTSSTKKQKCDENGENCTDAMTTGEEEGGFLALPGSHWLANREVAAALDKLITLKGASVTPVQDAPDVVGVVTDDDVDAILHRRDLIALFAGEDIATHASAMVLGAGWNKAKPETRPDLPSPLDGASGGAGGGGCSAGTGTC